MTARVDRFGRCGISIARRFPRQTPRGRASTTPLSRAVAWARIRGASRCRASAPVVTEAGLDTAQVQGPQGQVYVRMIHGNSASAGAPVLVLLHPVNLTGQCWIGVAAQMRDFFCVLIDSRGHGRSHMNGPFGIDDYAADV